jgi:multidrug efflux pump subunit AcrA (membrane-fusion protein)
MSTTTTENVKPKRTFGQKVKRFLKITLATIGGVFLLIMALGIYLSQQEESEKVHAAALNSVDPGGRMTDEQREKALAEKKAADALAKKAADEQREQNRKAQAEQEKAAREAARAAKEAEAARIKAEGTPMENAELVFHGWKIGGFGVIFLGDFSIKNKGVYPIKDFDIRCTVSAASGTELGTVRATAYEMVKPRSTMRLKELNMGVMNSQATKANCEIRSVERAN